MPKVVIPYPLRKHTEGKKEMELAGGNLAAVIKTLVKENPGLESSFESMDFIYLFVNGKRVLKEQADWEKVSLKSEDEISVVLPIAGGACSSLPA